eukprot:10607-Heterococcus_DN1.PRE.2
MVAYMNAQHNTPQQQILHSAHSGPVTGMSASPLLSNSTTATSIVATAATTSTGNSNAARKAKPGTASRSIMTWSGPRGEVNRYLLLNPVGNVPQNSRLLFRRRMCFTLPISAAHAALQLTAVSSSEDTAQHAHTRNTASYQTTAVRTCYSGTQCYYTALCELLQHTDTRQQQQRAQQLEVVVSAAMGGFITVVDRLSTAAESAVAAAAAAAGAVSSSVCAELSAKPSAGVLLPVRSCAQSCYDEYAATGTATNATYTAFSTDTQHSVQYEQAVMNDSVLNLSTTVPPAVNTDGSSSGSCDMRAGSRSGLRSSARGSVRSSTGVHGTHSISSSAYAIADNDAHSDCDSDAGRSVHVAQVQCDVSETDISATDESVLAADGNSSQQQQQQQQSLLSSRSNDASISSTVAIDATTTAATAAEAAEAVLHKTAAAVPVAPVIAVAVASRKQQQQQ